MLPRLVAVIFSLLLVTESCSFVSRQDQQGLTTSVSTTTRFHRRCSMASRDKDPPAEFTTNKEDLDEASKLKARLKKNHTAYAGGKAHNNSTLPPLPSVEIAEGAHKYVLIRAQYNGKNQFIVTSKKGAHYHRNAAEPMIWKLEEAGYSDIEVEGGGRISLDVAGKEIAVFGHSYGFGQANHAVSRMVIKSDERYKDFDITISDEGY